MASKGRGERIGLTVAVASTAASIGLGFAVPSSRVATVVGWVLFGGAVVGGIWYGAWERYFRKEPIPDGFGHQCFRLARRIREFSEERQCAEPPAYPPDLGTPPFDEQQLERLHHYWDNVTTPYAKQTRRLFADLYGAEALSLYEQAGNLHLHECERRGLFEHETAAWKIAEVLNEVGSVAAGGPRRVPPGRIVRRRPERPAAAAEAGADG